MIEGKEIAIWCLVIVFTILMFIQACANDTQARETIKAEMVKPTLKINKNIRDAVNSYIGIAKQMEAMGMRHTLGSHNGKVHVRASHEGVKPYVILNTGLMLRIISNQEQLFARQAVIFKRLDSMSMQLLLK